jgi:hypothetical protein
MLQEDSGSLMLTVTVLQDANMKTTRLGFLRQVREERDNSTVIFLQVSENKSVLIW